MPTNNKGYTLMEVALVLALSSVLLYSILYMPFQLMEQQFEYNEVSEQTADLHILRKVIAKDIMNEEIKQVGANTVEIGGKTYEFDGKIKREGITLTKFSYEFELDESTFKVFNENRHLEYHIGGSFSMEGDS